MPDSLTARRITAKLRTARVLAAIAPASAALNVKVK